MRGGSLRPHLVDFAAKVSSSDLTVLSDVFDRCDDGGRLLMVSSSMNSLTGRAPDAVRSSLQR